MASSDGTSVVGSQVVISGVDSADTAFTIGISGDGLSVPPSRVGYYYLVRYSLGATAFPRVYRTGIVFRPGVRFLREARGASVEAKFQLWVDWNFAGLEWIVSTGAS